LSGFVHFDVELKMQQSVRFSEDKSFRKKTETLQDGAQGEREAEGETFVEL
jgi:hypothetical protein